MARVWMLIVLLLVAFMEKGMSATSDKGNSNTEISSSDRSEQGIPDLNIPLVEDTSVGQSSSHMTTTDNFSTKNNHSSRVNYHSKKDSIAEFKEKERERLRRYRSNQTEEQKKLRLKKVMARREERKKADSTFRDAIRKAGREAYYRSKGRKLAEKAGRPIKPEHVKRKPGRKIKPLPPHD